MEEIITLDYGSGGEKTAGLIKNRILKHLSNAALSELSDAAVIDGSERLVFSTDSFVVSPCFFPGGNIGKLAVCGTVNDISVCGGEAKYLSLGLIIEEGFPVKDLDRILQTIGETAKEAGVMVVTGDTKVVEKGKGDGIYINTAGIGFLRQPGLSPKNLKEGDAILASGTLGDHGTAIMLARNEALLEGEIFSDCALVQEQTGALMTFGPKLKVMRDPTRGGAATTLAEFAEDGGVCIELEEQAIPVKPSVESACELLGLDPLYCACEGRLLAAVEENAAAEALALLRGTKGGENAAIIGRVTGGKPGRVLLKTRFGSRILTKLAGEQLPRIC